MTELELRENILNLKEQLGAVITTGEAEKRELNEDESKNIAELRSQIDNAEAELAKLEEENRKLAEKEKEIIETKENKSMEKNVRMIDLINGVIEGRAFSDEEKKFVQNGVINLRGAIQATVAGAGQENVPEEKMALDLAIRNASVLNRMGATWFSNAVGDISIPRYAGSNVAWKGEVAEAADGASAFTETILTPKRLTAYVDVSKQFLLQDSNDAEAILISDLAKAISEKFDKTIMGSGTGDTNTPAGLFSASGVVTGTSLSAITYEDVLDLERMVEEKNGYDMLYIAHPSVKYALKGTDRAAGFGKMVWDNNEIDGIPAIVSNSVVNKGLMCIVPRDLAVATWNGVEITVDTTSRAIYGEVRLVVNYYCDAKLREQRVAREIFS